MPGQNAIVKDNIVLGSVFSLLCFLLLSVMNALAKKASSYEPTSTIIFVQSLVSLILIIPFILYQGIAGLKTRHFFLHVLRAVTGMGAWFCLFEAIRLMPMKIAVLLCFAAPLWIPVIAGLFFKEKIFPKIWVGIIIGFFGIMLVLGIHAFQSVGILGLVIGVSAGILMALAFISVKLLSASEAKVTILFYYFLLSSLMVLPAAWPHLYHIHLIALPYLISIGLCLAVSQLLLILAYTYASAVKLSPYIYSVIIFSAIIDWIVWHSVITALEGVGIMLVLIGGVFAMRAGIEKPL